MTIAALVEYRPVTGHELDVERILRDLILQVRDEPGCLRCHLMRRADGVFVLYEAYADMAAVDAHRATAHYKIYRLSIEPLLAEPIAPVILQPIEP